MSYSVVVLLNGKTKEFSSADEPVIDTIGPDAGPHVALRIKGDHFTLVLPLGAGIAIKKEETKHPAIMQDFLDEIKPEK